MQIAADDLQFPDAADLVWVALPEDVILSALPCCYPGGYLRC